MSKKKTVLWVALDAILLDHKAITYKMKISVVWKKTSDSQTAVVRAKVYEQRFLVQRPMKQAIIGRQRRATRDPMEVMDVLVSAPH
jgi:hypothetical protein